MKIKKHKITVHEHQGISIREVRPGYFMVDVQRDGKRERVCFDDLGKAQRHCEKLAGKIKTEGTDTLLLTPTERQDAIKALRGLKGKATLQTAAAYWMKHHGGEEGVTVAELGRRWLASLKAQGCRDTTLAERGQKIERLTADMGGLPVNGVTRDNITAWLSAKGLTGATWDGYRRAYRAMFQFAAEEGLADINPVAAIKPVRMDERLPTPFNVEQVTSLLRTAAQWTPEIVPTLAVQFFAGLRPGEALGLDWSAVNFKDKTIRVLPETSKMRRSRIVPMNAALAAWLTPYRKASGPIGITGKDKLNGILFTKRIGPAYVQEGVPRAERKPDERPKGLAAAAGVKWIQDGPRKTFASAHYAVHGDAAKLAAILGHTGGHEVLFRHYRGLMTKAEGKRLFAIRPAAEKVVRANFRKAAG